jgi:hypothetical protein
MEDGWEESCRNHKRSDEIRQAPRCSKENTGFCCDVENERIAPLSMDVPFNFSTSRVYIGIEGKEIQKILQRRKQEKSNNKSP